MAEVAMWPAHDQARILVPVAMPGEPNRLWAVAWGEPGGTPQVRAVASPLDNVEQMGLWGWLSRLLWPWASQQADDGQCKAQIVMASAEAAGVMQSAADRLLRVNVTRTGDDGGPDLFSISKCAQLLWWAISEQARPGSHLIVPMQEAFNAHWVFGGICNNIQDQLDWIDGHPPIIARSPWADLWPPEHGELGTRLLRTVQRWGNKQQPEDGQSIRQILEETALSIWSRVQDAWMVYRNAGLEPTPGLGRWCRLDSGGWCATRDRLDSGLAIAIHDNQISGIRRFGRRTSMKDSWEHAMMCADHWQRLLATARGEVIEGQAVCTIPGTWTLITEQLNVRLRTGDLVHRLNDLKRNYTVRGVHLNGDRKHIELQGNTAGLEEFEVLVPRQPVDSTGRDVQLVDWVADRQVPIPVRIASSPPKNLMQLLGKAKQP